MTDLISNTIEIEEALQRLKQEQATFDQRKNQEERWFALKLRMGYSAVLLLPAIAGISGYIILNSGDFSGPTITAASAAMFVDVLGLMVAVWKVILNPQSVTQLEPVTQRRLDIDKDGQPPQLEKH